MVARLRHGLENSDPWGSPRPTAFDVIDPKIIQHRRYRVLFCCRKLHALGLLCCPSLTVS
jgi:hypothetical protein